MQQEAVFVNILGRKVEFLANIHRCDPVSRLLRVIFSGPCKSGSHQRTHAEGKNEGQVWSAKALSLRGAGSSQHVVMSKQ